MKQTAVKEDFDRLHPNYQQRLAEVLRLLDRQRLSCRCEVAGRDIHLIVATGLSSARYWMDKFGIDD
jgi:hypothetical protein